MEPVRHLRHGRPGRPALRAASLAAALCVLASCLDEPAATPPSVFDLKPPTLLEAGPEGGRAFVLRFDEEVEPVAGSFSLDPGLGSAVPGAGGSELRLAFEREQEPGREYSLFGEVRDAKGNGSRFLLAFTGYNGHPARLRITEVQTAKNSSTTRPHRDFVEFLVLADGNLGGMEFTAASTVKRTAWRFPGAEVRAGEVLVLHCAPEGLASERDETGLDLGLSGGIDSSPARDFWSKAGALPDATGLILVSGAPGGRPVDALFYAEATKSGPIGEGLLGGLVEQLLEFNLWKVGGIPAWEDAFLWKPSSARSILRRDLAEPEPGAVEWRESVTSGQSPGTAVQPP